METKNQNLGKKGELFVCKYITCPSCKKEKTFRRLPPNFKCADIICDFCGYLAQVKTKTVSDVNLVPDSVIGAAWSVQEDRMNAGIYFPLFLILVKEKLSFNKNAVVYYLSADLQERSMFIKRQPLSASAKRKGWQGFNYNLKNWKDRLIRIK